MTPSTCDIFDINDAFAVDDGPLSTASSSPSPVMPQFLIPELVEAHYPDGDGLLPSTHAINPINSMRSDARQSVNPWDPRLATDLALGVDSTEEIIERYSLSKEDFEALCEVPAFRRELSVAIREMRENGLAYSERCKVQSMMYLERVDQLIHDAATPAGTVLEAIKWIGKMAKLEPKDEKGESSQPTATVNIQINYST